MATVWEMVKSDLPDRDKLALWQDWNTVLGLHISSEPDSSQASNSSQPLNPSELPPEIQQLLTQRAQARENKDWPTADQLRATIESHGYRLEDTGNMQQVFFQ
jgi:cysteinyl-tRNA synthetase